MLRILICDDVMMWNPQTVLGEAFEVTTATSRLELIERIRQRHGHGDWDLALVDMVWDRPDATRRDRAGQPTRQDQFDGVDAVRLLSDAGVVRRALIHSVGGPSHRLWIEEAARNAIVHGSICKPPDDLAATLHRHMTSRFPQWDPLIPAPRSRLAIDVIGTPDAATGCGRVVESMLHGHCTYSEIAKHLFLATSTARKHVEDLRHKLIEVGEIGAHMAQVRPQTAALQWVNQHRAYLESWARRRQQA